MSHDRQPHTVTRQPPYQAEPMHWMKLSDANNAAARLDPGGSALAIFRRWDITSGQYVDITENPESHYGRMRVYDPAQLNFLLPNEIFQARLNVGSGRYEVVGSCGLWRKAKVKSGVTITAGGSGQVSIWVSAAEASPAQYVTAYLNWMDTSTGDLTAGTEVRIEWLRDESRWIITNADC